VRIETITTALDLTGVFANPFLGGAAARSHRLDLFGYVVIGLVSGLGGGVIRVPADSVAPRVPPAVPGGPPTAAISGPGLACAGGLVVTVRGGGVGVGVGGDAAEQA
jgi:uncharacterized membrane protein YeiH